MKLFHIQSSQNHMATTFDFTVSVEQPRVEEAQFTLEKAHQRVAQLEKELSEFLPESPVYQLNQSAPEAPITLNESARRLLSKSLALEQASGGYFSCRAKSRNPEIPLGQSADGKTVWRHSEDTQLSFGAIGKGFALDEVAQKLAKDGFENFLLNAGGSSLFFSGFSAPQAPWNFGWSWENTEEAGTRSGLAFQHRLGVPVAVGVSGRHEKGNHILNPHNRKPVTAGKSALIATKSAAEADALSTAFFAAGWENAHKLFSSLPTRPAMASIDDNDRPRWNGIFTELWGTIATLTLIFCFPILGAEEEIDLSTLGISDFTPYQFERNSWWILLPALILGLVFLHLVDSRPKHSTPDSQSEEKT